MKKTECYFYRYKVLWYDPDSSDQIEEGGLVVGKDYSDACANVAELYDDAAIGYIHLTCLTGDPGYVLFDEDLNTKE